MLAQFVLERPALVGDLPPQAGLGVHDPLDQPGHQHRPGHDGRGRRHHRQHRSSSQEVERGPGADAGHGPAFERQLSGALQRVQHPRAHAQAGHRRRQPGMVHAGQQLRDGIAVVAGEDADLLLQQAQPLGVQALGPGDAPLQLAPEAGARQLLPRARFAFISVPKQARGLDLEGIARVVDQILQALIELPLFQRRPRADELQPLFDLRLQLPRGLQQRIAHALAAVRRARGCLHGVQGLQEAGAGRRYAVRQGSGIDIALEEVRQRPGDLGAPGRVMAVACRLDLA